MCARFDAPENRVRLRTVGTAPLFDRSLSKSSRPLRLHAPAPDAVRAISEKFFRLSLALASEQRRLRAAANAELVQNLRDVRLDRRLRHTELRSDLLVVLALAYELEHASLLRSQIR